MQTIVNYFVGSVWYLKYLVAVDDNNFAQPLMNGDRIEHRLTLVAECFAHIKKIEIIFSHKGCLIALKDFGDLNNISGLLGNLTFSFDSSQGKLCSVTQYQQLYG